MSKREIGMKNKVFVVLAVMGMSAACSNVDFNTLLLNSNSSNTAKLNACMLNEANSRANAGTLFTSGLGVRATAEDIAQDCIKKLTLQACGLDNTAVSNATNIINALKDAQ